MVNKLTAKKINCCDSNVATLHINMLVISSKRERSNLDWNSELVSHEDRFYRDLLSGPPRVFVPYSIYSLTVLDCTVLTQTVASNGENEYNNVN